MQPELLGGAQPEEPRPPLAARMRPRTFDEFVGQQHLVAPGRALRQSIEHDHLTSLVLWGPPGSGKTTLAEIIAAHTQSRYVKMSAVSAGVADIRKVVEEARKLYSFCRQRTVLFLDEIHRFNKAQQDALLPHVETGLITLVGATTQNPSYEVNSALLSRCRVFQLEKLGPSDIASLLRRALEDPERGVGSPPVLAQPEALDALVRLSDGDARTALTALELAADSLPREHGQRLLTVESVADAMQSPALLYDRTGDMHYHLISAFIKAIRGSDPDAGVYWLARMLEGGEDPLFVARRLVILAAEDIGLADPHGLVLANACFSAVHSIGMPEAYLPLTECVLYLALAPKSNSTVTAYANALDDVRSTLNQPVPLHLRNAVTAFDRASGYGRDYAYAHDFEHHVVKQQYLPDVLVGKTYYQPGGEGQEDSLHADLMARRKSDP